MQENWENTGSVEVAFEMVSVKGDRALKMHLE